MVQLVTHFAGAKIRTTTLYAIEFQNMIVLISS